MSGVLGEILMSSEAGAKIKSILGVELEAGRVSYTKVMLITLSKEYG